MLKLNWHEPNFIAQRNFSPASDTSTANLYLLRKKYNIEIAESDGILFRRYNGSTANRRGYGFPLSDKNFDLNAAIELLKEDSELRGENLRFCLCSDEQRAELDKIISVDWHSFDGDSDYIYKREDFAQLSGRKFHRKKNFVNRFKRLYPDAKYFPLTVENLPDALQVAEKWFAEHDDDDVSLQSELMSIHEVVANWKSLDMKGGVIYADGEPAVMIMFSILNEQCLDVHFEKATNKFAADGAFAVVNQCMASSKETATCEYVNREEDMGIIGLKKSKESYRPIFKIKKYYGEIPT